MSNNNPAALNKILQAVLDSEQLSGYYHTDVFPERIPLRLLKNRWIDEKVHIKKFGQPAVILNSIETEFPYMNIVNLEIGDESASLSFEYPPEGLTGTARLLRKNDTWNLDSMELREK